MQVASHNPLAWRHVQVASTALSQSVRSHGPSDSWRGTWTSAVGGRRVREGVALFNVPLLPLPSLFPSTVVHKALPEMQSLAVLFMKLQPAW